MADAPITDKFGNEIADGDTVEFVFGGDAFVAQITDSGHSTYGIPYVAATVTLTVPAGSVALVEKAEKPKKSSHKAETTKAATEEPAPAPEKPSSEKGKK